MKVAILHNPRPEVIPAGVPDDTYEEYDGQVTVQAIAGALKRLGLESEPVIADKTMVRRLEEGGFGFVFNIAEGSGRRCREAVPAAVCELLGIPYTGSDALTLAVTLDKATARRVVSPEVPVAAGALVERDEDFARLDALRYPVLVKPNDEGSSKGIRSNPIANDAAEAIARCQWLREQYGCAALVEEFVSGVEVTVGITGNGPEARCLGAMEIAPVNATAPFVYSLEVKRNWREEVRYFVPPRLDAEVLGELHRLALTAYRLLGCLDFARMDFRLDASGRPHFLECNALPGLNPESSDIVFLSRDTVPYDSLVQGILVDAARRQGVNFA
ncbi:MAG: D-alanine--D-alanine ligase [Candidatus Hydrogenedentes bacterium]|nr:D-alanine--D-alanine ligase [Candidatus Hydrogenedentota bacterium]